MRPDRQADSPVSAAAPPAALRNMRRLGTSAWVIGISSRQACGLILSGRGPGVHDAMGRCPWQLGPAAPASWYTHGMKLAEFARPAVPVGYAQLILDVAATHDVAGDDLLAAADVPRELLDDPNGRLTAWQAGSLLVLAMEKSGEPAIGYEIGLHSSLTSHGLMGYGLISASTVREAIALGERFLPLRLPMVSMTLSVDGPTGVIEVAVTAPVGTVRQLPPRPVPRRALADGADRSPTVGVGRRTWSCGSTAPSRTTTRASRIGSRSCGSTWASTRPGSPPATSISRWRRPTTSPRPWSRSSAGSSWSSSAWRATWSPRSGPRCATRATASRTWRPSPSACTCPAGRSSASSRSTAPRSASWSRPSAAPRRSGC